MENLNIDYDKMRESNTDNLSDSSLMKTIESELPEDSRDVDKHHVYIV